MVLPTKDNLGEWAKVVEWVPASNLNTWWGLSEITQNAMKALVPDQDSWTLECHKHQSGVWTFSLPQFLTFDESLCNGTEDVIDWHFTNFTGYKPAVGEKLTLTVSTKEPSSDEIFTKCLHMYEDPMSPESNIYYNSESDMDVWLCPYLQVLFKGVPTHLYITFEYSEEQLINAVL